MAIRCGPGGAGAGRLRRRDADSVEASRFAGVQDVHCVVTQRPSSNDIYVYENQNDILSDYSMCYVVRVRSCACACLVCSCPLRLASQLTLPPRRPARRGAAAARRGEHLKVKTAGRGRGTGVDAGVSAVTGVSLCVVGADPGE